MITDLMFLPQTKEKHAYFSIPRLFEGFEGKPISHIDAGHLHTVAISTENEVYTWGWGASGKQVVSTFKTNYSLGGLGHGDKRFQLMPKVIASLQGEPISQASAGTSDQIVSTHQSLGWKQTLVVKA